MSCQSSPGSRSNDKDINVSARSTHPIYGLSLASSGDNAQLSVSADGQGLLYQSRERNRHRNPQAYQFDLRTQTERRVTWSDGVVTHPVSFDSKNVIYLSNTDREKEVPSFLRENNQFIFENDLFLSELNQGSVSLLLRGTGFLTDLRIGPKRNVLFLSIERNRTRWLQFDVESKNLRTVTEWPQAVVTSATESQEGTIFWAEYDPNKKVSLLRSGKSPTTAVTLSQSPVVMERIRWLEPNKKLSISLVPSAPIESVLASLRQQKPATPSTVSKAEITSEKSINQSAASNGELTSESPSSILQSTLGVWNLEAACWEEPTDRNIIEASIDEVSHRLYLMVKQEGRRSLFAPSPSFQIKTQCRPVANSNQSSPGRN